MARRRKAEERKILPDPIFGDQTLSKFINCVMERGKKSIAEKIVYGALDKMAEREKLKPKSQEVLELFKKMLRNVIPTVEVRAKRLGGATYQVPAEVNAKRGMAMAMRWLIGAAKQRAEKGMMLRLFAEMMDALENRGNAIRKREETFRMAMANKANAHIRI
jgi:small subunit ribosomal protein S7